MPLYSIDLQSAESVQTKATPDCLIFIVGNLVFYVNFALHNAPIFHFVRNILSN